MSRPRRRRDAGRARGETTQPAGTRSRDASPDARPCDWASPEQQGNSPRGQPEIPSLGEITDLILISRRKRGEGATAGTAARTSASNLANPERGFALDSMTGDDVRRLLASAPTKTKRGRPSAASSRLIADLAWLGSRLGDTATAHERRRTHARRTQRQGPGPRARRRSAISRGRLQRAAPGAMLPCSHAPARGPALHASAGALAPPLPRGCDPKDPSLASPQRRRAAWQRTRRDEARMRRGRDPKPRSPTPTARSTDPRPQLGRGQAFSPAEQTSES
ncbi:hypothetical protein G7Z17_g2093 [Cylindrodendrum hubeiense]|uniref:Uncharacterized protein n=1 Tax=Cylindrodendrum hubeiense TaxID=595255 RepID=A0A9P5LET4_9HYPO|nr:hypothetical protein G7Z17_g2093 [Cylindrodendrum hubeiense]